jgi:hypothetical protein
MQVPAKKINRWKMNLDKGDKKLIRELARTSRNTITEAFKGTASAELIMKIDEFFENKKQSIK